MQKLIKLSAEKKSFVNIERKQKAENAIFRLSLLLILFTAQCLGIKAQTTMDTALDFDGDGRTDYCVVRIENNQLIWYIQPADGSPHYAFHWGLFGDVAVPEDFDGDGRDDIAIWRPTTGAGYFYILQSQTNSFRVAEFGILGDDPSVVRDYDGDGKADLAVYRNAAPGGQSYFYYLGSQNNPTGGITFIPWGTGGDYPVSGDTDGDGRGDFIVQRSENGASILYLLQSSNGVAVFPFGLPTDLLAPADYDGDGRTDFCAVRRDRLNLSWWIRQSSNGNILKHVFGLADSDFVTVGDYTGDGRADISVWRPNSNPTQNFFYVRSSDTGVVSRFEWGIATDYPSANFQVH